MMRMPRTLKLLTLFEVLLFLQTNGDRAMLLEGSFVESTDSGHYMDVFDTEPIPEPESCFRCALFCIQKRVVSGPTCQAYSCHPTEKLCRFYSHRSYFVAASGPKLFLFRAGDKFHKVAVGDHLFSVYLGSRKMNFTDARKHCNAMNGYLLEFDSKEEYDAVNIVINGQARDQGFVGATDIAEENKWVTDREGVPIPEDTWQWSAGSPSDGGGFENCGTTFLDHGLEHNDVVCWAQYQFLCERDVST